MREYDPPTLAALQTRAAVVARALFWVTARNRATGLPEALGLWTGAQDRSFTIDGVARPYVGAGSVIEIPAIRMAAGLDVRVHRITLSPLSRAVADLIRLYDLGLAPVEIHRALFSPGDGALIAAPHRMWKGFVDEAPVTDPEPGGEARCEITMASTARLLTRSLALKKSDATQQLRSGDRFRRYIDVSGEVTEHWGVRRPAESRR